MAKPKSRAQIELAETEGMTQGELEAYMRGRSYITAELTARYLGGFKSPQGVRIQIREGKLPIAQYCHDGSIRISPERTIKFKHGELGLDEKALTDVLVRVFEKLPELLTDKVVEAVREELHQAM